MKHFVMQTNSSCMTTSVNTMAEVKLGEFRES